MEKEFYASGVEMKLALSIKNQREKLNLTPDAVAARIGVSEADFEKIESGRAPVSVGRLCEIANALDVHPYHFFDPDRVTPGAFNQNALELLRLFASLKDPEHKRQLIKQARELAADPSAGDT